MPSRIHCAEYVSPGHPDRLADAVAEASVQHALALDPLAFAAIEVAVSTDKVFVTGRLAAGPAGPGDPSDFLPRLAREAYRAAGYGTRWAPAPESLLVTHDLCCEPLLPDERAIRDLSDDQAICVGYACASPATDYLPPAHWLALRLGERLCAWRHAHAAERFGPDFKLLPVLEEWPAPGGRRRFAWRRLILSMQHAEGMSYEEQHRLLLPFLARACAELDGAVPGVARFEAGQLLLNGAGEFSQGGTHGDNGLSGKKLVVDGYGPGVPIGGGAVFGKDPRKPDRREAARARELAVAEVKAGAEEAVVTLVIAPGEEGEAWVERRQRELEARG